MAKQPDIDLTQADDLIDLGEASVETEGPPTGPMEDPQIGGSLG